MIFCREAKTIIVVDIWLNSIKHVKHKNSHFKGDSLINLRKFHEKVELILDFVGIVIDVSRFYNNHFCV